MTTPKDATPTQGISAESIAKSGEGLIRLWVAAISLPLTAANALGATFNRLVTGFTSALDGNPVQSNSDIVKATNELVQAGTSLYTSLLDAAVKTLQSATKAIDDAVAENLKTPGK